jgi:D-inositol-3-phosphate glycosyltransferase
MKSNHLALITLHADPSKPSGTGEGGGTHSYIRELMVALPKENWNLTVLTRWADANLPEFETISSRVRIVRLRIGEVNPLDKRLLNGFHRTSLTAAEKALKVVSKVDLIHSVYWNSGRVAADLSKKLKLRFVQTVISNGWRRLQQGAKDQPLIRLKIEKQVFTSAFTIFCISHEERDDLVNHYEVDSDKIVIIGRPVANNFRHPPHDEMGKPFLVFLPEAVT